MKRFEGPVRFRFNGDPELARQYMALGRKYLGQLLHDMEIGGITHLSRQIRTQNGTTIKVYSGYGIKQIEITRDEQLEEEEVELEGNFVTVPASDEAPTGWGEPFVDGNGTPINPPLGTIGGNNPQTLLTWDGADEAWDTKRYNQFKITWPLGLKYGNVSWHTTSSFFGEVVLSWNVVTRYKYNGGIVFDNQIYYNGYEFCKAPENIVGLGIIENFLVVLCGKGTSYVQWYSRPFQTSGYLNDNFYNEETNPAGWRECDGSSDYYESINRFRQIASVKKDGSQAISSVVTDFSQGGLQINAHKIPVFGLSVVSDRVSISLLEDVEYRQQFEWSEKNISYTWNGDIRGYQYREDVLSDDYQVKELWWVWLGCGETEDCVVEEEYNGTWYPGWEFDTPCTPPGNTNCNDLRDSASAIDTRKTRESATDGWNFTSSQDVRMNSNIKVLYAEFNNRGQRVEITAGLFIGQLDDNNNQSYTRENQVTETRTFESSFGPWIDEETGCDFSNNCIGESGITLHRPGPLCGYRDIITDTINYEVYDTNRTGQYDTQFRVKAGVLDFPVVADVSLVTKTKKNGPNNVYYSRLKTPRLSGLCSGDSEIDEGYYVQEITYDQDDTVSTNQYNRTKLVAGNLRLGYFLLIKEVQNGNNYITQVVVKDPKGFETVLFTMPEGSLISFPSLDNLYDMSHKSPIPSPPTDTSGSGTHTGNSSFAEESLRALFEYADKIGAPTTTNINDAFNFYFAAHDNPAGQVIVTAWVKWLHNAVVHFGSYDFITDGDLVELTEVQGTNQRHIGTGVI